MRDLISNIINTALFFHQSNVPLTKTVMVTVFDEVGALIPEATVQVLVDRDVIAEGITGPGGTVSFLLNHGTYNFSGSADGFSTEETVHKVSFGSNNVEVVIVQTVLPS